MKKDAKYVERRLRAAKRLERTPAKDFNMDDWEKCIAGHCFKLFKDVGNTSYALADYLGLTSYERVTLFFPPGHNRDHFIQDRRRHKRNAIAILKGEKKLTPNWLQE